jgi:IS30 family transposase
MSLNEAPAMLDAGGSGAVIAEADLRPRPAPGGSRAARPATEGDLLICKRTRPVLILKEREIRSVPAVRLAGKSAAETVAVMMAVLRRLDPRLRSSVTFDNHTAFARHGLLTSACAMTTWFRDAYASWQKGVVENAKGRLCRDLPRDLGTPGDAELREIVLSHNLTPREVPRLPQPAPGAAPRAWKGRPDPLRLTRCASLRNPPAFA